MQIISKLLLLVFTFHSSAYGFYECANVEGSETMLACTETNDNQGNNSQTLNSSGCGQSENPSKTNIDNLEDVANAVVEQQEPVNYCHLDQNFVGEDMSKRDMRKLRRKLHKQCKKKAKAYKKEVAKNLLSQGKIWQALQARLKSKRGIIGGKRKNTKNKSQRLELDVDEEAISKMSKEEFSAYMLGRLKEQMPNLDALIEQSKNSDNAFTGSLADKEVFPMNVVIKTGGGNHCVMKSPDFPQDEFEAKECEFCEVKEMQDNFSNDCSYMIGKKNNKDKKLHGDSSLKYSTLSEDEARSMMGISTARSSDKSDPLCNKEMDGVDNKMSELHQTAIRLCDMANNGQSPDLTIQATRNLYNDYTEDLAQKRGEFTQKYLYKRLKDDCQLDVMPSWLEDEDSFQNVVKVEHPEYLRPGNKEGNYGPSPYAQGTEQEKEIEYLKETLEKEKEELLAEREKYASELSKEQALLSELDAQLNKKPKKKVSDDNVKEAGLKAQYQFYKNKNTNYRRNNLMEYAPLMNQILSNAESAISEKHISEQKISDLTTKIASIDQILNSKYQKVNNEFPQVKLLGEYYEQKNAGTLDKEEFDKKLFNQFKMSRIKWGPVSDNPFGIPDEMVTPELALALKSILKINQYTCQLQPMETKKLTVGGILKFPLKVAMGGLAIAGGAVVGAAAIAISPITTLGSFASWCAGCADPGSKMPDFFRFGNWRMFGGVIDTVKSPSKRKALLKDVNTFIGLGGKLNVYKDSDITEHTLNESAERLYDKPYGSLSSDEQIDLVGKVIEEAKSERSIASVEQPACNDVEVNLPVPGDRVGPDDDQNSGNSSVVEQ